MPTDPFPHLKQKRPRVSLRDERTRDQIIECLIRDPGDPEVDAFLEYAEKLVTVCGILSQMFEMSRAANRVAALKVFRRCLQRLIDAYEEADACHRKLAPETRGFLGMTCTFGLHAVLAVPVPSTDPGEKADLLRRLMDDDTTTSYEAFGDLICSFTLSDEPSRHRDHPPLYIIAARDELLPTVDMCMRVLRENHGTDGRHRRREPMKRFLIGQLADTFQQYVKWDEYYDPMQDSWDSPTGYQHKLLPCIRLILDKAGIDCPKDKMLLNYIPQKLRQPPTAA